MVKKMSTMPTIKPGCPSVTLRRGSCRNPIAIVIAMAERQSELSNNTASGTKSKATSVRLMGDAQKTCAY